MENALEIWQQRLEHLRRDDAISSDSGQRFSLQKQIEEAEAQVLALSAAEIPVGPGGEMAPPRPLIDLSHLPPGAEHFLARDLELAALDAAWDGGIPLITLIAPGGVGKTALVRRWLAGLRQRGWAGAARVFAWSFYSQGSGDDRQASEDQFLAQALDWFEIGRAHV
jgi:hypothetical protein